MYILLRNISCSEHGLYSNVLLSWCSVQEPSHRDSDPALIEEDMSVMSDFELHRLCQQYSALQEHQLTTEQLLDSGKLHLLTRLLTDLKEQVCGHHSSLFSVFPCFPVHLCLPCVPQGHRVALFSQFTMILDILEVLLKHHRHRYIRMDGSTPMSDR